MQVFQLLTMKNSNRENRNKSLPENSWLIKRQHIRSPRRTASPFSSFRTLEQLLQLIHGSLEPANGYAQKNCAERFSALKARTTLSGARGRGEGRPGVDPDFGHSLIQTKMAAVVRVKSHGKIGDCEQSRERESPQWSPHAPIDCASIIFSII